jgi:hypothetical protein
LRDYGPSPAVVALTVAALLAAALSIWLAASSEGGSNRRASTDSSVRGSREAGAASRADPYQRVEGPVTTLAPAGDPTGHDVGSSTALCRSGTRVVSGGYQTGAGGGGVFYSGAPANGRVGWAVGAVNDRAQVGTVQAFAYCVSSGQPDTAVNGRRLARQRGDARRATQALVNRYRILRSAQRSAAGGL